MRGDGAGIHFLQSRSNPVLEGISFRIVEMHGCADRHGTRSPAMHSLAISVKGEGQQAMAAREIKEEATMWLKSGGVKKVSARAGQVWCVDARGRGNEEVGVGRSCAVVVLREVCAAWTVTKAAAQKSSS